MRAVVQRVSRAQVTVGGEVVGRIGTGLLILLGVTHGDGEREAAAVARKLTGLRIFEDEDGKMNLSLLEAGGTALVVSQFTLYADIRRGRRPSFTDAAAPETAERLYGHFCDALTASGVHVERGVFGAHMAVELVNDGPVTILIDSQELAV